MPKYTTVQVVSTATIAAKTPVATSIALVVTLLKAQRPTTQSITETANIIGIKPAGTHHCHPG